MGAGAQLANAEELAVIQQGAKAWNEWRGKNKERASFNLSGADLQGRDLTGADLRGVDLSNAVLRGATLGKGTLLWNANLSGADLYQANLRSADLQDVNFSGADLYQANLRESNLQGAELSAAKGGLLSRQLAGSDLTGAKLPEPLSKLYDSLSSVKEISDSAQKLFVALLAGCLYSWLTIAQTTDVELITNRATTPLPIIQAAIPIVGFYVVAPLILLCLYFYFHFYLQKLWEELGSLPAVFTDGRELHKRTDPWLLNDLVRSHFVKLKDDRPFLSYFQAWISVVLAWWLVPITLFAFWLRFLRRHDLFWTIVHALLLALAIFSAIRVYRIANSALRGEEPLGFRFKGFLKRRSTYRRLAFVTELGAVLVLISTGTIGGERGWSGDEMESLAFYPTDVRLQPHSPRTWMPWLFARIGYHPFASITNADVSIKPSSWTGRKDEELDLVKGADLKRCDLRSIDAFAVFFAKANLSYSSLDNGNFGGADFRQANLDGVNLKNAYLRDALLQDSHINLADLRGATFDFAHLDRVSLKYTQLAGASLSPVILRNSHLNDASLEDSNLTASDLTGSDLTRVNLTKAHLFVAKLEGVDLQEANLTDTDLIDANLNGANLKGARLSNASLQKANIKYADFRSMPKFPTVGLTREMIVTTKDWQLAFYDFDMLAQLGLPPDHNEKLQKQMQAEQQAKSAAITPPTPK